MGQVTLLTVQPVFAVPDLAASAGFYRDVLGFRVVEYLDSTQPHICLYRDSAEIILTKAAGPVVPSRELNGYGYDAYAVPASPVEMYQELRQNGAKIVVPIHCTDYDSTEFVIEDIDGRWIGFGNKNSEIPQ